MKKLSLKYLDTCLPDYFQGFGGEVLAVAMHDKMRSGEVLQALHSEIEAWSGYMSDFPSYYQATDANYEELHKSAKDLFSDIDKRKTFNSNAGNECYCYFGIMVKDTE